jgi:hypothetical protein
MKLGLGRNIAGAGPSSGVHVPHLNEEALSSGHLIWCQVLVSGV